MLKIKINLNENKLNRSMCYTNNIGQHFCHVILI